MTVISHRPSSSSVVGTEGVELHRLVATADDRPGYLARFGPSTLSTPLRVAALNWALEAMTHLNPEAAMFTAIPPEIVVSDPFRTLAPHRATLIPIVDPGRVGRRRLLGERALETAKSLGMSVLVGGHRPHRQGGADGIAAVAGRLPAGVNPTLVIGIGCSEHAHDAQSCGSRYLGGPWIADPIRLAPVDVSALRR